MVSSVALIGGQIVLITCFLAVAQHVLFMRSAEFNTSHSLCKEGAVIGSCFLWILDCLRIFFCLIIDIIPPVIILRIGSHQAVKWNRAESHTYFLIKVMDLATFIGEVNCTFILFSNSADLFVYLLILWNFRFLTN